MSARHPVKTIAQVRADFLRRGQSVCAWARDHGYSQGLVFEVLRGRLKGRRGQAHEVAVLLGLKDGVIENRNPKRKVA